MIKDTVKYRNLTKRIKKENDKEQREIILMLLDYICVLDERITNLEKELTV